MVKNLLLVCTGNICRSPMAEGIFRNEVLKRDVNFAGDISSAGLHALVGQAAVIEAREVMSEIGIDISKHRARQLTQEMALSADLILVMEKEQKAELEFMYPHVRGRVHLVGKWGGFEILDPYQGSAPVFQECLQLIVEGCQDWVNRI